MLLDGYKFDLRLYVLVTSFRPLEAFVYTDGFARVSTQRYTLDPNEQQNKFIHLTNSSIQKMNDEGVSSDNPLAGGDSDSGGSKISLSGDNGVWARMKKLGHDTGKVWSDICLLLSKSLVAVDDKMSFQPNAFEVFGYDVLIDSKLKPWLIEVNASPSMSRDSSIDFKVKDRMIRDTIALVDPLPFDRAAVNRIMNRRMKEVASAKFSLAQRDPMLEDDLRAILGGVSPRAYGEEPRNMGGFTWLAPNTPHFDKAERLKGRCIKSGDGSSTSGRRR